MTKRATSNAVLVIVGVLVAMGTAHAAKMTRQADVITISETIKGSGTDAYPEVTAVQSPVANISGLRRPSTPGGTDLKVATPPWPAWPGQTSFANNSEAEEEMGEFLEAYSSNAANRVCTLLSDSTSNAHMAAVDYYQTITVHGEPARLTGSLLVRDNCESNFMGVRVTNKFERVIFASYRQGALVDGLPSGWRLPMPGVLQWKMYRIETNRPNAKPVQVKVDGAYEHKDSYLCTDDESTKCPTQSKGPLGEWGYYDEPQTIDKNDGSQVLYHCRISDDNHCNEFAPTNEAPVRLGGKDVFTNPFTGRDALLEEVLQPLLKEHNAEYVVLDYGRTVHPQYKDSSDGNGKVPQVSINVQERKISTSNRVFFITPAGGGKYTNKGYYGYQLKYAFNRSITYQGDKGTYNVQQIVKNKTSPEEDYSKKVSVDGKSHSYFTPRIIDPFATDDVYEWKHDDVNDLPQSSYEYVAPLTIEN